MKVIEEFYKITNDFAYRINSFFTDLGLIPTLTKIIILKSEDYDGMVDTTSNISVKSAESERKDTTVAKPTTGTEIQTDYQSQIVVREKDGKIDLAAVMDAILKYHFPNTALNVKARESFEKAFSCYDKLYTEQQLRSFFIALCKNEDNLLRIAQIKAHQ